MNRCDTTPSETPASEPESVGEIIGRGGRFRRLLTPPTPEQEAERQRRESEANERRAAMARDERLSALAERLGERYSPSRCSLDTFRVSCEDQRRAVATCSDLVARMPELIEAGEGMVFYGPVGTGKDHLLAAMLYAAVDAGHRALWVNGQDVYGAFHDRIDSGQQDESAIRYLVAPKVLGFSDPIPPGRDASGWDLNNLARIIDRRYRAIKPTWLTINALTLDEADEKLSAPVFDRLRDGATLIPCFWPSHRAARK